MIIPGRTTRYEYMWEMMGEVEQQCETCVFRKDDNDEFPMCYEVEGKVIQETIPVKELDYNDEGRAVCNKYKEGNP